MKRKIVMYGSICILGLAICMILIIGKEKRANSKDNIPFFVNDTTEGGVELNESVTSEFDDEQSLSLQVLYLEDETVQTNDLFHAFINKEIAAYDETDDEDKYIYEYYGDYVYGVHYMAEDLDGNNEDELLIFLQHSDSSGDLLVFNEVDGELYAWETWKDFLDMHMMSIEYYDNGIFSKGGSYGEVIGYYNSAGKIEYIIEFYSWIDNTQSETNSYIKGGKLILYEEGIEKKELEYEGKYYIEDDFWEMTAENQEYKKECDSIINDIKTQLGEGRLIRRIEGEDAKTITLEELLNPR